MSASDCVSHSLSCTNELCPSVIMFPSPCAVLTGESGNSQVQQCVSGGGADVLAQQVSLHQRGQVHSPHLQTHCSPWAKVQVMLVCLVETDRDSWNRWDDQCVRMIGVR